jgi:hypothetical protein
MSLTFIYRATIEFLKLPFQNSGKFNERILCEALELVPENLRGNHGMVSTLTGRNIPVHIIKIVNLSAGLVVLCVAVNPVSHVIGVHDELDHIVPRDLVPVPRANLIEHV